MGPKGKLWFDDDPGHDLVDRILRACRAYRRAFGEEPNVVHVNVHEAFEHEPPPPRFSIGPNERVTGDAILEECINVVFSKSCLPNHYFVFREEEIEQGAEREAQ